MRIVLVRHGQTPHNVAGALDTARPGAGLTPLGVRQAAALVDALAEETVSAIFCSPLVRTRLTAHPLADHLRLEVHEVEGLEEISAGDLEMSTARADVDAYDAGLVSWWGGDLDARLPGGEDGHGFLDRYDAALRTIAAGVGDGTAVVVSHGAAIRTFLVLRAGVEGERLANTAGATLVGDPDSGWRLVSRSLDPLGGAHLRDDTAHDVTGDDPTE